MWDLQHDIVHGIIGTILTWNVHIFFRLLEPMYHPCVTITHVSPMCHDQLNTCLSPIRLCYDANANVM